jgi:hypothetical protein
MFNNNGDDEWQIEFHRNASKEVTGAGDAQRVFATVLAAIQQFIQKQRPWRVIFSASKDVQPGQNSQSRAKLYNSLVARYARAWGYDEYNEDHGDQVTYELTRLNQDIDEMSGEIHGGVRKALMAKGYEYLGSGIDKQAYMEPGTGQVLIVFGYRKGMKDFSPDQRMFIDWINYCNANKNNPHLPKFSGFESFQFGGQNYIQARMEPLRELPDEVGDLVGQLDQVTKKKFRDYRKPLRTAAQYATFASAEEGNNTWYELEDVIEYLGGEQAAKNLLQTVYQVQKFARQHRFSIDLHRGNYMQRPDGTIVVNDPFVLWLSSSGQRRSWGE